MIISTQQVNPAQLKEIKKLSAECKQADGGLPNLYLHILEQHRAYPACLLYYQNQELQAFLSCYFFYEDAVEISVLISPMARRKGIARNLLQAILPLVQFQGYQRLIFSSPQFINDAYFRLNNYAYLHSEFYMERNNLNPVLIEQKDLVFRSATLEDIQSLCQVDALCFPNKQDNLLHRFEYILNNREYEIIIAQQQDKMIGKAHFRWQKNGATLSDIAIVPKQQGQGFGSALIAHCINQALTEGKPKLSLDVETHNQKALNLYTRLDFSVQNACDYWAIAINELI